MKYRSRLFFLVVGCNIGPWSGKERICCFENLKISCVYTFWLKLNRFLIFFAKFADGFQTFR